MSEEPIAGLAGYRRLALAEVASTNASALEMARGGDPGNLWVTAQSQSAGKGRRGRPWVSKRGNLYASLLLIDAAPISRVGTLPLVAGLGVHRALRPFFASHPQALAIKWPNDLLVDGQKICGILLESETLADGRLAITIGCGINCSAHPENPSYPTTDLAECGLDAGPEKVFPLLASEMARVLTEWNGGAGFASVREDLLLAARGKGGPVTVRWQDSETAGIFEDIDHDGYLLLNVAGERRRISAGDLFFSTGEGRVYGG